MTSEEELRLSRYREVSVLDEGHDVWIVRRDGSEQLMVRKRLKIYNGDIYAFLRLHHIENTPYIYEAVEDGDTLIVIEEYINGKTLEQVLEEQKVLPENKAVEYMLALCGIISELHHVNPAIVHRDIKPSNIIITPDGQLKLIDLNAAKYQDSSKSRDTTLLGTEGYAAPEQYGFGASDTQTDIYAAGVLFNVMLTGVLPQEMTAPGAVGEIIKKCTRLERSERYISVDLLKNDLEIIAGLSKSINPNGSKAADDEESGSVAARGIIIGLITLIGNLPGFRSEGILHKAISAVLYIAAFGAIIYGGMSMSGSAGEKVLLTLAVLSVFIAEVLFIGNCGGVLEKFAKTEPGQPVPKKKTALGAFLVFIAVCAFYAVLMMLFGF